MHPTIIARSSQHPRFSELSQFKVMEWLFWLRNFMILAQLVAILAAVHFMEIPLPVWPLGAAPLLLLIFNLLVYWRIEQGNTATVLEISVHLLFDMLVFTYLLYWTGGSANPFVSAYLVPIALAAAFGALRHALALGFVGVALYSFLMLHYIPLPPMNGRFGGDFSLHVFGMWLNFILSALITIAFVYSLARLAREREIALKKEEQNSLNSQHLIALGSLAAGAAHELATPLSNIGMLADEMAEPENSPQIKPDLAASLKTQVSLCQAQIRLLRNQANLAQHPEAMQGKVAKVMADIIEQFKAMRSDISVTLDAPFDSAPSLIYDISLNQTLLNLLNNAADSSVENGCYDIRISHATTDSSLAIYIDDFGTGLKPEHQDMLGEVPFSTKQGGIGIGLLLAQANIKRLGGELALFNRKNGVPGVRAEITLPLVSEA